MLSDGRNSLFFQTKLTMRLTILIAILLFTISSYAQRPAAWNGKQCAVVLTYDDAIDVDLDNVVPALDSMQLKGTFYIIGASSSVNRRVNEWGAIARNGHELGNHSLRHPCDGSLPGRTFATPENDLSRYTVDREVNEIRINNILLKAIDGKDRRTFAYPCGDTKIRDTFFYDRLNNDFA